LGVSLKRDRVFNEETGSVRGAVLMSNKPGGKFTGRKIRKIDLRWQMGGDRWGGGGLKNPSFYLLRKEVHHRFNE